MRKEDKDGNGVSDIAADKGAEATDVIAAALGYVYAMRHKFYKMLIIRIQVFIIKVRKAEKDKRGKRRTRKSHSGRQEKQRRC